MSPPPSSGSSSLIASNDNDDITTTTTNDKMFFTTSDLINTMNTSIQQTNPNLPSPQSGGFELQRKMPDGTYRRADESEIASANFQSKMKQSSELIKSLNPQQKIEWSKYQREQGNVLFSKGEYTEAMDVYLTCLVAMDNSSQDASLEIDSDNKQQQQQLLLKKQIDTEIKLPVLLNLALSALKLGMLSKAEQFCNYAIDDMDIGKQSVKAYFRRGRIRMLRGHFGTAELDLDKALELIINNIMLESEAASDDNDNNNSRIKEIENEKTVILREKQKLSKLVNQASANKKKQKKAMQQLFKSEPSSSEVERSTADLYPEKKVPVLQQKQPTYFEYYMHIIGRGAQKLLDIIGHGEDEDDALTDQQYLQKKNT